MAAYLIAPDSLGTTPTVIEQRVAVAPSRTNSGRMVFLISRMSELDDFRLSIRELAKDAERARRQAEAAADFRAQMRVTRAGSPCVRTPQCIGVARTAAPMHRLARSSLPAKFSYYQGAF